MKHAIPVEEIGPFAEEMANAVTKCVHCGFCLPACPTYNLLGEEMDSPRGRIVLMKSVLEGKIELSDALPYIDRCLGCLGCVTACPSGVPYDELVMPFRSYAEERRRRPAIERFVRILSQETIPHPGRFRAAARLGNLAKPVKSGLPKQFSAMLDLLPPAIPPGRSLPDLYPAQGTRNARVALLAGCVQQVLDPEINWASVRVLARNGVEVHIPKGQGCCGGLALHSGDSRTARQYAIRILEAFQGDYDAIITNAAGCGSTLQDYPLLFKGTRLEEEAKQFASRVVDISEFLSKVGIEKPSALPEPTKIAYHDACHLAHAQGITNEPRYLLSQIPNAILVPLNEGDLCCGSAGSYNLEQPEIADKLGARKIANILNSGAQIVVTGNIGCLVQIRSHLASQLNQSGQPPKKITVLHTIELIDRAYRGDWSY